MSDAARSRRGLSPGLLAGLAAGLALGIAPAPVILMGGLLAPGWMLALFERRGRRATVMLLFGAVGAVAPMRTLLQDDLWIGTAWTLLATPRIVAHAWLAALLGWGLAQTLPELVLLWLNTQARGRVATMRRQRARLAEEWSIDT